MGRGIFSISLSGEKRDYFEKIPDGKRSEWVADKIGEEMQMDEKKLTRKISELESELSDAKETLILVRKDNEAKQIAVKRVEENRKEYTKQTLEGQKKGCPVCNHPELNMINEALRNGVDRKEIKTKWKLSPIELIQHQDSHMVV